MSNSIPITDALQATADAFVEAGYSEDSPRVKLLRDAKNEIDRLNESIKWHIDHWDDTNKQRLRWMERYQNGQKMFEEVCRDMIVTCKENSLDLHLCYYCKERALIEELCMCPETAECSGYETDECFKLDEKRYWEAIEAKQE